MIKLRNETRIGILAIVAVAAAFWGYQFLKGRNVLTSSQIFYVKYPNVDQLRPSSPVFISGLQVGMVKDIIIDDADDKTLIVTLNIKNDIQIPKDASADIVGLSLMGGKAVEIVIPHPCDGDGCAKSGDFLQGKTRSLARSLLGDPADLDVYVAKARMAFDTLVDPNSPEGLGPSMKAMESTLKNMVEISAKVDALLAQNRAGLNSTINSMADISKNIKDSNGEISATIANLRAVSEQIKNAQMDVASKKAAVAIDSMVLTLSSLKSALDGAEKSIANVETLSNNLVGGQGTAGKLLTDDAAYQSMISSLRQISMFLQDFRLNPKRYNTVKLKVFGKNKAAGEYEMPYDDPAYQMMFDSLGYDYFLRRKAAAESEKK